MPAYCERPPQARAGVPVLAVRAFQDRDQAHARCEEAGSTRATPRVMATYPPTRIRSRPDGDGGDDGLRYFQAGASGSSSGAAAPGRTARRGAAGRGPRRPPTKASEDPELGSVGEVERLGNIDDFTPTLRDRIHRSSAAVDFQDLHGQEEHEYADGKVQARSSGGRAGPGRSSGSGEEPTRTGPPRPRPIAAAPRSST